jgi:hypothetical protein
MSLPPSTFYSLKSTKLVQNIWFPPLNCSTIKLWARSRKNQKFGTGPMLWGTVPIRMGPVLPEHIQLSKPKFNQQLNWTEFEVKLHSYREVHHQHHTNSLLLLFLTATDSQAGRLYNSTVRVSAANMYYDARL